MRRFGTYCTIFWRFFFYLIFITSSSLLFTNNNFIISLLFKVLNQKCKKLYRKLERTTIKQISAWAHPSFNETCLNNKLLPPYIYI